MIVGLFSMRDFAGIRIRRTGANSCLAFQPSEDSDSILRSAIQVYLYSVYTVNEKAIAISQLGKIEVMPDGQISCTPRDQSLAQLEHKADFGLMPSVII